jgi:hypothetical protein
LVEKVQVLGHPLAGPVEGAEPGACHDFEDTAAMENDDLLNNYAPHAVESVQVVWQDETGLLTTECRHGRVERFKERQRREGRHGFLLCCVTERMTDGLGLERL